MQSFACESIVPALLISPPAFMYKVDADKVKLVPLATTSVRPKNPVAETIEIFPLGASNEVTPEPAIPPPLQANVPLTLSEPAPSKVPPLRPSVLRSEERRVGKEC